MTQDISGQFTSGSDASSITEDVQVTFTADGEKSLSASVVFAGEYDPGNLTEIDRAIRHMPGVVAYTIKKANECLSMIETSHDFRVVVSYGDSRVRAYVAPANDAGIHLELGDSVLLKAAISMGNR